MAEEVLGSALIEISPDFSQFQAQLTTGLLSAVKQAQKAAEISLKVDVNASAIQGVQKSFAGVQDTSSALSGDLKQINATLNQVGSNVNSAAKSIQQASLAMQQLASNSRSAGKEAGGLSRVFETVGSLARFASNITNVIANVAQIAAFGKNIGNVVDKFQSLNKEGDTAGHTFKSLGAAIAQAFLSEEDAAKLTQQFSGGLRGLGNVVETATSKLGKNKVQIVETASAQDAMNKIFGTTSNVVRDAITEQDAAAQSASRFTGVINGVKSAFSGIANLNPFKGIKASVDEAATGVDPSKKIQASVTDSLSGSKAGNSLIPKSLIDQAKTGLDEVRNAATNAGAATGAIGNNLQSAAAGSGLLDSLRAKFAAFRVEVDAAGGGIRGFISALGSSLSSGFKSLGDGITGFFDSLKGIGNGITTIGKAGDAVSGIAGKLSGGFSAAIGGLKNFATSANGAELAAAGLATGGIALAAVVGQQLVSQLGKFVQQGIAAAATIQTLQISLKGIFQSTDAEAKKTFDDIQKFSALTPFTLETATSSVIKLKASFQSFTAKDALSVLKDISSAAAATGGDVDSAVSRGVLAITQIGARGKLSAQDLQQFADAIPSVARVKVFDEIAKSMGKTREEVQKLAETGGIDSAKAINGILAASRGVPGAQDALLKQSKTFAGALSTIKDNFSQLLGNAFLPFLQNIGSIFSKLDTLFAAIKPAVDQIANALGQGLQAIAPTIGAIVIQFANLLAAVAPLIPIGLSLVNIFELPLQAALAVATKVLQVLSNVILGPVAKGLVFLSGLVTTAVSKFGPFVNFVARVAAAFVETGIKIGLFLAKFTPLGALINFIIQRMGGLSNIVAQAKAAFIGLGEVLNTIKNAITGAFGAGLDFIKDKIKTLVDIASHIPGVSHIFKELKKSLDDTGAAGAFDDLTGAAKGTSDAINGLVTDPAEVAAKLKLTQNETVDLTQDMGKFILTAGNFGKALNQIAKDAIAGTGGLAGVRASLKKVADAILAPLDPFSAAVASAEALKQAKLGIAPLDKQLADLGLQQTENQRQLALLQLQRKELQDDTTKGAREEADAVDKILGIQISIREIQEQRDQLVHDENNRQQAFLPALAKFDDDAITANINLIKAKRGVVDAQKAINDAVKAGNLRATSRVDLTGLSLDEIKAKLANNKASLAAQTAAKTFAAQQLKADRDKQDLQNNLLEATIGVHDAEAGITKNAQDKVEFLRQQTIAQREFTEKNADLNTQEAAADRSKVDAINEQGRLLRGEIGYKHDLKELDRQIASQLKSINDTQIQITEQTRQRAEAGRQLAISELQAKSDSDLARGNIAAYLVDQQKIFDLKKQGSGLDDAANTAAQVAVNLIKSQQTELAALQTAIDTFQNKNSAASQTGLEQNLLNQFQQSANNPNGISAADALRLASNVLGTAAQGVDALNKNLTYLSRVSGHPIPLPLGADGGVFSTATDMTIGEAGREVLLPLTRPGRLTNLLNYPGVLAPILAALPTISLARAMSASTPLVAESPSLNVAGLALSHSPFGPKIPAVSDFHEKEKERTALADAIADAMVSRGVTGQSIHVEAPVTVQTPGVDSLTERAIVERVLREIEKRF